jgi:tetratricopeptide (TPR) repeat protein
VDEILTDLTKVADLKVISRNSVMQYTSDGPADFHKIAAELAVAHVLVGSVRRVGPTLRVNAQLVDTITGAQIWAERYDRGVSDIFAVETQLAEAIVDQLHAKLSPGEKAAIAMVPTSDLEAFELYTRARELHATSAIAMGEEKRLQAIELLDEATKRDPNFLRAYCALARIHGELYLLGMDHTPTRLNLADAALQSAVRLQPEAGETHLAAAFLHYCQLDYSNARRELVLARRALPNESFIFELGGYMDRRQGRWKESEQNLRHALDLDPRNFYFLQQLSFSYERLRRFDDMRALLERAIAVAPDDPGARINRAQADLFARADTKPERATFDVLLHENPQASRELSVELIQLALYERDFDAADRALAGMDAKGGLEGAFAFPRGWYAGLIARAKGDAVAARASFNVARSEVAQTLEEQGEFPQPLSVLAMIDAALGNNDAAISAGRRACRLLPVSQDAITGADIQQHLAVIYTWCGYNDQAFDQLSLLLKVPGDLNYGLLVLDPAWDPLRADPRFAKIVASVAPKAGK